MIEEGAITKPLKGIRISDNMLNILRNVTRIGNDPAHLRGWEVETPVVCPHVQVNGVNITRSVE